MPSEPHSEAEVRRVGDAATRQQLALPCEPVSARAARRFVAEAVELDPGVADEVALLVSELASNAILHARSAFTVTVAREADTVLISVTDHSPVAPVVKPYQLTSTTGRGLRIVESTASRWGWEHVDDGKTVWFEVDHAIASQVA